MPWLGTFVAGLFRAIHRPSDRWRDLHRMPVGAAGSDEGEPDAGERGAGLQPTRGASRTAKANAISTNSRNHHVMAPATMRRTPFTASELRREARGPETPTMMMAITKMMPMGSMRGLLS